MKTYNSKGSTSFWLAGTLSLLAVGPAACTDDVSGTGTTTDSSTGGSSTTAEPTTGVDSTGDPNDSTDGSTGSTGETGEQVAFTLQLLHAADQEGNVEAVTDAPRFSGVLEALRAELPDATLTVTSGDVWIPGPFYASGSDVESVDIGGETLVLGGVTGRPDIAMHNAMGFQAAAFGNHEWDRGDGDVSAILGAEDVDGDGTIDWPGAAFPYLSANLDYAASAVADLVVDDRLEWTEAAGGIARSTVVTVDGEPIGVVGTTTPTLETISSPGGVEVLPPDDSLETLAEIIQEQVDALTARGIDKVVVLAHMQQIAVETELAGLLSGVDVIVAGGSNTLLADDDDVLRPGDEAQGSYPTMLTNADGDPLALVNTDGNYRYVGRLVVGFDDAGVIVESSLDPALNGAWATDEDGLAAVGGAANPTVAAIADAVGQIIVTKDGNTFGATSVWLEGRRTFVRSEETNLGNLTANANLAYAQLVDPMVEISVKNGGGIRREIGFISVPPGSTDPPELLPPRANPLAGKEEGEVSQLDIEATLAFNNGLSLLTLNTAELKAVLERGVSGWAVGATPGAFPQVAGMRVSFDPAQTAQVIDGMTGAITTPGERIRNVAVLDGAGDCVRILVEDGAPTAGQEVRMVILDFLANGGDGYPLGGLAAPGRVDLEVDVDFSVFPWSVADFAPAGTEQDSMAEFLAATTSMASPYMRPETPADVDARIQNLSVRADTVLDGCP